MKSAYLVQSLPADGKGGLIEGGFTHTITAKELIEALKACHDIDKNEELEVIGVGATENLSNEISYMGNKLYLAAGESGEIRPKEIPLDTKISFSQIALQSVKGVSKIIKFDEIKAPIFENKDNEINKGGVLRTLLKAIGGDSSAVISLSAKTKYIESRGVCPIVKETGKKISPATDLKTMTLGGKIKNENGEIQTIRSQTISRKLFKRPEVINLVGIITGENLAENKGLPPLHLHCKHGHVLDLGSLYDVKIEVTPITKTFILLPEKNKGGNQVWHSALQEKHLPSLVNFQNLFKVWSKRGQEPEAFKDIKNRILLEKQDLTTWVDHVAGKEESKAPSFAVRS